MKTTLIILLTLLLSIPATAKKQSCLPGVPCLPWCPADGSVQPPKCRNGNNSGG